jgi:hypothetical protein
MSESMFVQVMWTGFVVFGFLGLLIVPAAIIESRWGRSWIHRLSRMEQGRIAQRAEYLNRNAWHGPERLP